MSQLAEMVSNGFVRAEALVYRNANSGFGIDAFFAEMEEVGFAAPVEGRHYAVNPAATPWFCYTGTVWFSHMTPELLAEIHGMLDDRDSKLVKLPNGEYKTYNNPLFREVVALGCWREEVVATVASVAVALVHAAATRDFDALTFDIEYAQLEAEEYEGKAAVNRKAGFLLHAKELASKAFHLRRKVERLQAKLLQVVEAV